MSNKEQNAVWVISTKIGTRYDKRRKKQVDVVDELTVVGTDAAQDAAANVVIVHAGATAASWSQANEAVQMKRAGYLP